MERPLFRAEAVRYHHGRASRWKGKYRRDLDRALTQAKGWRQREPEAVIEIACTTGMRATLEEIEASLSTTTL